MSSQIEAIESRLNPLREQLKNHELYATLKTLEHVKTFTEFHVYAVWDFMSLLKALQMQFTCVQTPWMPAADPAIARFINEIVHGEESDLNEKGEPNSHFEMYLDAMREIGASTASIEHFVATLRKGTAVADALQQANAPQAAQDFVNYNFSLIEAGKAHEIASAFTFGREDVIPDMFIAILDRSATSEDSFMKFRYYLDRHIELDGDEHGPISLKMIEKLCGSDPQRWKEAEAIAITSLEKRIALWDSIYEAL
jgi:hypothetical protein